MSVDTEKPSLQSNETNQPSNNNDNNSPHKSITDSTITMTPSTAITASIRMTGATSSASSLAATTTASSRQQTPRSQTPPIPPQSRPTIPESPRASYFRRIREQQERAMEKFFQTTIDAPCNALEESIDHLTKCQQPQAFWNMFHHESHDSDDLTRDGSIPMGMYVVPPYCEYCGASSTRLCPSTCQRPKLFFRKKRPPFCNDPYPWDAQTEYQLPKPKITMPIILTEKEHDNHLKTGTTSRKANKSSPSSHWVPRLGIFHGHNVS